MDLGVFGVEQHCRECSIRLLMTGIEQCVEHRPREIVHIDIAGSSGKEEEDHLEIERRTRRCHAHRTEEPPPTGDTPRTQSVTEPTTVSS